MALNKGVWDLLVYPYTRPLRAGLRPFKFIPNKFMNPSWRKFTPIPTVTKKAANGDLLYYGGEGGI